MAHKVTKVCDKCLEHRPARYRVAFDAYLCEDCYRAAMVGGDDGTDRGPHDDLAQGRER